MPYIKAMGTKRLVLPSNPEYWVEMKDRASWGDRNAAQEAMLKVTVQEGPGNGTTVAYDAESNRSLSTDIATGPFFHTLICRLVTAWNLDDEAGRPLPISAESLLRLDSEDGDMLFREARRRLGQRTKGEDIPFERGSSSGSKATPSPTGKPRRR